MSNLKRIFAYLAPHKAALAIAIVCMILSGVLSAAFFFLFQNVLGEILKVGKPDQLISTLKDLSGNHASDAVIAENVRQFFVKKTIDFSNVGSKLNFFIIAVFFWAIARVLTDFCMTYITQRTGQRALAHLRADLFAHFQKLSVGFFESRRTGEIMSRMTNDLSALQTVLTMAVITAIRSPVEAIGSLGFMFYQNWKLSLGVLVILPPLAWLINRAGFRIRRATAQLQEQLAELTNYLQEKISAMRLIQTFGTSEYEIAQFNAVNHEAYRRTMKPIRIQASLGPSIEFISYIGVLVLLWFGARGGMEPEALMTFLFAMHRAAMNLKAVASLNNMFKTGDAAASRLMEMFDTEPEVRDAPNAIDLRQQPVQGHLKFENVRFAYGSGPEVLHGISFEIKPGESVALAGLSGSGKSTIAALVPRLYDPTSGRVLLDGHDLRDVALLSLRAHIGAVPQETTLFHGTIRDNIAYGNPDATLEQITEAARRAHADEFIRLQPQGYETPIGERGGRLSGGQRQRIAIARALLRDPRVLLLDEATSALDAESEAKVQDALEELMRGRTTLIIAHRFSTIQHANRILVLEDGNIAETGTHQTLLEAKGRYHDLYQKQAFAARNEKPMELLEGENDHPGAAEAAPLAFPAGQRA